MANPKQTGLTANSKNHMVLDAAVVYKATSAQLTAFETALGSGSGIDTALNAMTLLGATKGGVEVNMSETWRQIEVDGVRGKVKGFDRLEMVEGSVKATLLEWSKENLELLFPQVVASDVGSPANYRKITGDTNLAPVYHDAIVVLGNRIDPAEPMFIVLKNAICSSKDTMSFQDKNEATIGATFEARFDPAAPNEYPFVIYTPVLP